MSENRYTRLDLLHMAILAALALALGVWIAWNVTGRIPHLEDEIAYIFQARTFARGALVAPAPPSVHVFFTPFTLVIGDGWIGKYSIGWPLLLALGEVVGAGWLTNPVLGAALAVLAYALGRDLFDRQVGLTAGLLALTSPFFLVLVGTYMSHIPAAVWAAVFTWAWSRLDRALAAGQHGRGCAALGGAALGMLAITRQLTAVAVAVPFAIDAVVRLARGRIPRRSLAGTLAVFVVAAALVTSLEMAYLWATTGSPLTNLYTAVWPYDRIGFGPDIGPHEGHTLRQGLITTRQDITLWASELYGWRGLSWVLPAIGLTALLISGADRRRWALLLAGPFIALVMVHVAYWVGAQFYGPRYYFEAHAGLAVLAGAGLWGPLRWLSGQIARRQNRSPASPVWAASILLAGLIAASAMFYLPERLEAVRGLYGINRAPLDELERLRDGENVLVLVQGRHWVEYAALFSVNTPWLDGPIVAAHGDDSALSGQLGVMFPDRTVWYYHEGEFSQEPFPYKDSSLLQTQPAIHPKRQERPLTRYSKSPGGIYPGDTILRSALSLCYDAQVINPRCSERRSSGWLGKTRMV